MAVVISGGNVAVQESLRTAERLIVKRVNPMHRLTLTESLIIILLICALAFGVSRLLQSWLISTTERTSSRMSSVTH